MCLVKWKLLNGINMYLINYYSIDKDYVVIVVIGRVFNSLIFCFLVWSILFMFIYGLYLNW